MYNKQQWKDEIPDLTKPIKDSSGKQKTDPQTGRPLYELVQEGTRLTSQRLNHIEDGIETVHELADQNAADIDTHKKDTVKHITAAERAEWKAKETTAGAQTKADAALSAAKTYADTALLAKADKSSTYSKTETDQRIQAVVGAAPDALDTLKEIGDALNNDPNFAATVTNQLSGKVDKVSGKQLSTEDYSSAEKAKLAGLTPGAGAAGSATDATIGNRTADPSITTPYSLTGTITQWFSWITKYFKAITGKANPFDTPDITLAATKTHVDNTTVHITAAERTAWNAAETNAKNASIPLVQKGAASGVPAMDVAKYMLGDGISLKEFSTETVHTFSFTHNVANQKVDLSTTGALAGFFEVTVTGTFGNQNNVGRMTKRFNIMTNTSGTINSQLTQYTEVTGPIVSCLSISDAYWSASSSQWRITIDARTSNGNGYAVHIKRLTSQSTLNTKPFTLGTPYTGTAATTLPIAVQTIPDDTVTQSGYLIQKHLLTDNSGKNIKLPNGTDLDTVLANGFYNGIALVNAPTTANVWYYIEVQQHTENSQFVLQRATLMSGTAGDKPLRYERIRKLNVWSTWVEIEGADKKNVANGYAGVDVNVKVARVNTYNDLGGISALSNLDTAYTAGTYSVNANAVGTPSSGEYGQVMIHVSQGETHTDVNWIWQMFFGTAGNTFVRRKVNNGAWQNWVKLWTGYNDSILFLSRWMIPNGSDINAFTTNGCYSIFQPTGLTNFPAGVIYGILNVTMADVTTNYAKQEIMDCTNGTIYTRGRTGSSTWTSWVSDITSAGGTMEAPLVRKHSATSYKYNNVASYFMGAADVKGTIKITLPVGWNLAMMRIKISGYDYSTGKGAWELTLGGYNFTTGWTNTSAYAEGAIPFGTVRFAYDGSKCCILLGNPVSSWNYPSIEVSEVLASHAGASGLGSPWTVSVIPNEAGITNILNTTVSYGTSSTLQGRSSDVNATPNTIPVRDSNGKIAGASSTVSKTLEQSISSPATDVEVLRYTPTAKGAFTLSVYLSLPNASNIKISVKYLDSIMGIQTYDICPLDQLEAGSHAFVPAFFVADTGLAISVTLTSNSVTTPVITAILKEE